MAGTANIVHNVTLDGDSAPQIGNSVPAAISYTNGLIYRVRDMVIADNFVATILWAQSGGVSAFSFGVIVSNVDVLMELKNDKGTPEFTLMTIPAGVPVYFSGTTRGGTSAFLTTGVQTTGLGNVTQIKVQRNVAAAVGAATVQLMLFS